MDVEGRKKLHGEIPFQGDQFPQRVSLLSTLLGLCKYSLCKPLFSFLFLLSLERNSHFTVTIFECRNLEIHFIFSFLNIGAIHLNFYFGKCKQTTIRFKDR